MNNDYNIASIYQEMELYLIKSMKRNLNRHLEEEKKENFKWTQWQSEKLKELKKYQRENQEIITNTQNKIDKLSSRIMKQQFKEGMSTEKIKFSQAKTKGYNPSTNVRGSFFGIDSRKLNALTKSVNNDLHSANTATLRMINDEYREVIFKASSFASSGVMTPQQAVDMATKDFLSRGLNSIEYSDGRRVNIASYSQMAVRTAGQRAYLQAEGDFRKKIKNPLVKVPSHGSSCDKCAKFEGRILIDDVYSGGTKKDGKYTLLSEAMEQGLFHPNCQHPLTTYYKELDELEFDDSGPTETTMNQYYSDLNYCNRQIQKFLRLETGSLDKSNIAYYSSQKEEWMNKKAEIVMAREKLQNIVSEARKILPESFMQDTKGVTISMHSKSYSAFFPKSNRIILSYSSDVYDLIHELGHKYDISNNLFDDKEFVKIIKKKFKKYRKKDFKEINSSTGKFYILKNSQEFVSPYQTRIYDGGFKFNSKVNVSRAREYFTEGLKYYYKDPKLLKAKDTSLYNFIKKKMGE